MVRWLPGYTSIPKRPKLVDHSWSDLNVRICFYFRCSPRAGGESCHRVPRGCQAVSEVMLCTIVHAGQLHICCNLLHMAQGVLHFECPPDTDVRASGLQSTMVKGYQPAYKHMHPAAWNELWQPVLAFVVGWAVSHQAPVGVVCATLCALSDRGGVMRWGQRPHATSTCM